MGLFGKLFDKKECDICGYEIGLLGNRKLEDGNCCKECAAKLSPWFDERRHSTVEQIKAQLAYREENKQAVEAFNITSSYGEVTKLLLDEDARKFMVTNARFPKDANPDVLDFSQVTGVDIDIEERRDEEKRESKKTDGTTERVSYNPPRFIWSYDFYIVIRVNHPYFDDMHFQINRSEIELNFGNALPAMHKPNPRTNVEYREYESMAKEIKEILINARCQIREEVAAASAPKMAVTCPYCGATTTPDASGKCEFCGGAVNI